jgi:hypothetical protein
MLSWHINTTTHLWTSASEQSKHMAPAMAMLPCLDFFHFHIHKHCAQQVRIAYVTHALSTSEPVDTLGAPDQVKIGMHSCSQIHPIKFRTTCTRQ